MYQSAAGDTDSLKKKFDNNTDYVQEKLPCPFRWRATELKLSSYPDSQLCEEGRQFPNTAKLRFVFVPNSRKSILQLETLIAR